MPLKVLQSSVLITSESALEAKAFQLNLCLTMINTLAYYNYINSFIIEAAGAKFTKKFYFVSSFGPK